SAPSVPRGCRWMAWAPAATQAAPSRASSSPETGSCGWRSLPKGPLRAACSSTSSTLADALGQAHRRRAAELRLQAVGDRVVQPHDGVAGDARTQLVGQGDRVRAADEVPALAVDPDRRDRHAPGAELRDERGRVPLDLI